MTQATINALFLALVGLGSCGRSSSPSESEARTKLERQIQRESGGLIKLVSFEKTDGITRELVGGKNYEMIYTAEIEFLENCIWRGGNDVVPWDGTFNAKRNDGPATGALAYSAYSLGLTLAQKGQRLKFNGTLVLEQTENGWR